jgi:hypothetical protein
MSYQIEDPKVTEMVLKDAGFNVGVEDDHFVVFLKNRVISRSEVATVLGCETDDLAMSQNGVIVG